MRFRSSGVGHDGRLVRLVGLMRLVWWTAESLLSGLAPWACLAGGAGLAMALLGCGPPAPAAADGADPLAALAAPAQSARYDGPFWTREAHRDSRTWRAAKAYCRQARGRRPPNCHAVELVERWEGPWLLGAPDAPGGALPAPPPLPPPPAMHPGEAGRSAAAVAAWKAWRARLAARGRDAAAGGRR